jgi:membrane protein implicated in regulation of membrane protease activity
MNNYTDLTILLIISFLLITRPNILVNFSNTFIGKLLLIIILVVTTLHSTISGIFVAILIVVLSETLYEGMENKEEENKEENKKEQTLDEEKEQFDKITDMRTKHCKTDKDKVIFVDSKGNELSLEEVQQKYPSIKFNNDLCNPCDESCSFQITGALEQLTVQDTLRPKNSKEIAVNNKKIK